MNDLKNNNNIIKSTKNFLLNNIRNLVIAAAILFIIFISFQFYNYYSIQKIKKSSIYFFDSIDKSDEIIDNLNKLSNNKNIFSTLSKLKIIQQNNKEEKFSQSNELYKQLINTSDLEDLYISSISAHASYTLINASYIENTNIYLNDISFYISKISSNLESYFSIKKELEYLFYLVEGTLNNSNYIDNKKAYEVYNEILNSNLISSSVKERVKTIHEFQLYK